MERYWRFKFFLFLSILIFFFLGLVDIALANNFIIIAYSLSLFTFLFKFERPPAVNLEIPAVDYYRRSRFNATNYFLVSYAVISSLFLGIINYSYPKLTGIFVIFIWIGMVGCVELIKKYFTKPKTMNNMLADYISDRIFKKYKKRLKREDIFCLIKEYEKFGRVSSKTLKKYSLSEELGKFLEKWIIDYKATEEDPLLIEEIEEIQ
jgi:hypothetical protein